jgi:hypothetical protein
MTPPTPTRYPKQQHFGPVSISVDGKVWKVPQHVGAISRTGNTDFSHVFILLASGEVFAFDRLGEIVVPLSVVQLVQKELGAAHSP